MMALTPTTMRSWSMSPSPNSGSWWTGCSRPGASTLSRLLTTLNLCVKTDSINITENYFNISAFRHFLRLIGRVTTLIWSTREREMISMVYIFIFSVEMFRHLGCSTLTESRLYQQSLVDLSRPQQTLVDLSRPQQSLVDLQIQLSPDVATLQERQSSPEWMYFLSCPHWCLAPIDIANLWSEF